MRRARLTDVIVVIAALGCVGALGGCSSTTEQSTGGSGSTGASVPARSGDPKREAFCDRLAQFDREASEIDQELLTTTTTETTIGPVAPSSSTSTTIDPLVQAEVDRRYYALLRQSYDELVELAPSELRADIERFRDAIWQAESLEEVQWDAPLLAAAVERADGWSELNCSA